MNKQHALLKDGVEALYCHFLGLQNKPWQLTVHSQAVWVVMSVCGSS